MAYLRLEIVKQLRIEHEKSFERVDFFKHGRHGTFTFNFIDQFIFKSFFV